MRRKRPTRRDVAALAHVSVATVSYVVNDGPRPVSPDTRKRVISAIQQLGYRPHAIARSLRTGNTHTIGLLVQSLLTTYVGLLVNAVEDNLASRGYGLILASSHEDCERENKLLDLLSAQSIDGLIYIPISCSNETQVTRFLNEGVPVVFMDRYIPGTPADVVMTDNVAAARKATNYLIESGCRRTLCISYSDEASSALDRVEGFRQAHHENNLPVDDHSILVVRYAAGEKVEPALLAYIYAHSLPDGILCLSDESLVGSIKALKQRGIRVPEQVRLTGGFADTPWNALLEPPMPTVRQDFQRVAQVAVEYLMARIQGDKSPPRTTLIPAEFPYF